MCPYMYLKIFKSIYMYLCVFIIIYMYYVYIYNYIYMILCTWFSNTFRCIYEKTDLRSLCASAMVSLTSIAGTWARVSDDTAPCIWLTNTLSHHEEQWSTVIVCLAVVVVRKTGGGTVLAARSQCGHFDSTLTNSLQEIESYGSLAWLRALHLLTSTHAILGFDGFAFLTFQGPEMHWNATVAHSSQSYTE